jgi:hypothetical protein
MEQANRNSRTQLEELWKTNDVSEDDFYDAKDELVELGYDEAKIDHDSVIKFIKAKPVFQKAVDMTSVYQSDLAEQYEPFVNEVAKAITNFPHLDDADIITMAAKNLGIEVEFEDEEVGELMRKIPDDKPIKKKKRVNSSYIDSF